jgi:F-type H+-transporting ATPase subunit b
MSDTNLTHATVEAPSGGDHAAHAPNPMKLEGSMLVLTWIAFGLMAAVLYKVAWKPILAGLDKREETIRKALEDAERARQELARIAETRQQTIDEADQKARDIVDAARKAAVEAAGVVQQKAREESQILLDNARREIETAQAKALSALRKESADLAVSIARKIIVENLDEARSRALADKLIRNV